MSYQSLSRPISLKRHICVHKSDVKLQKGVNKGFTDDWMNPYQCSIINNNKRNQYVYIRQWKRD